MPTFLEVKRDVLRVFAKRDPAVALFAIPSVTTLLGSTTILNDSQLGAGTSEANKFDGRQIEIVEQVDSPATGAAEGSAARVDDAGFDLVDGLTLSPALDNTINTGTDYLLYPLGLSKPVVEEAINEVLRETQGPHIHRPSLVPDAALDNDTIATNWSTVGTPSTAPEYEAATDANTFLGERSIHAVADAGDEGFASGSIPVTDVETVLLSVFVRVAVGSVTVQLYNATASSSIKEVTIDEELWTEVRFAEKVPAACENIQLRILSDAASDDFYMGAEPIIQMVGGAARAYEAPSWLKSEAQILGWVKFPRGLASEVTDSFIALGKMVDAHPPVGILRDGRAQHPFRLEIGLDSDLDPVGMIVQREFDEVTLGVTATTNATNVKADRQYMRSAVVGRILRDLGDEAASGWTRAARVRAEQLGYGSRDLVIEETPTVAM